MTENSLEKNAPPIEPGLYLVATPLGNLGDITIRAKEALSKAALIAAEDTRRSQKLLNHLGIKVPVISYREQNHNQAWPKIAEVLGRGQAVALVTDAGAPSISDPGAYLTDQAREHGFKIIPLPGPSAVILALSASGFNADRFTFAGFPPPKTQARRKFLNELISLTHTLVFFEAPHRLSDSLTDMAETFGPRRVVLARELTKLHEEIYQSTLDVLAAEVAQKPRKGEITLVVEGGKKEFISITPEEIAEIALSDTRSTKELANALSSQSCLSRSEVYNLINKSRAFLED